MLVWVAGVSNGVIRERERHVDTTKQEKNTRERRREKQQPGHSARSTLINVRVRLYPGKETRKERENYVPPEQGGVSFSRKLPRPVSTLPKGPHQVAIHTFAMYSNCR